MTLPNFSRVLRTSLLVLLPFLLLWFAQAQGAKKTPSDAPVADADADHIQERAEWFRRGRVVPGKSSASLRHKAYQTKMQARAARFAGSKAALNAGSPPPSSGAWTALGPVPLSSDASGGFQDYRQVSGRATAVAIDPADATGNTVYIGGAQGGVWKSTNAATSVANNVTWTPVTDDQATLSIGAIAIQPGNSNVANSVVLVGTGEADNSGDSYYGLGILRSADGGNSWTLVSTANSTAGTLSFNGLGATRMAFSTATPNTVVAAMAATSEGVTVDALTSNTYRGLYTSTDAGQTWTYNVLAAGGPSAVTSATSVVYNAVSGSFFAAVRYNGFFSSPDGLTWTRLANQPGPPGLLSTSACPQPYVTTCPIYRGEITVVPGRNEMYVWFVSLGAGSSVVDQGIWQSKNGGASWTQISDSGITSCGDSNGCGVQQGFYDLELLAAPNGTTATDLYAGAINIYKCGINSINATCSTSPFVNLTHVYGCDPVGAPAHVHPDQHALAYAIPPAGTDLMYFANDGGIYRALDGFSGLTTGQCTGTNLFDDLNQNLGSMTQFVSFSEHATNIDIILGGTQDNGSPATTTATTSSSWQNVLGGDGGYNAIDPNNGDWFASNPDIVSLEIRECSSGVSCNNNSFVVVASSGNLNGDNGGFYFPYILDSQSATSLLVGTCRVWRGPRLGGAYSALSLNFDTLGTGICSGGEVNLVRALAAAGPANASGSQVVYATTDGFGPNSLTTPAGGNVWVTTNATAVSGVSSTFTNVTQNGPGSTSINPSQFPVSGVAIDASDITGSTAYVTVMGFTGGAGHVWQTTNAGLSWTDWTGFGGASPLPDSPVNAVIVDAGTHIVYVGTDVGVFQSPTSTAAWTEVGPTASSQQSGFLPNVAVTALALFNSGSQKLLRASTYGRGVWQFDLISVPDFQILVPNSTLTAFSGTTPSFSGTVTAVNGYNSSVTLSCTTGSTAPPSPCTPKPASFVPAAGGTAFTLTTGSAIGDYSFNVQAAGSDTNNTTHVAAINLSVVNYGMTAASPTRIDELRGAISPPVSFQVTAQGSFNQDVTLTCGFSPAIIGATCAFTPGTTVDPTSAMPVDVTATVTVPLGTAVGNYTVTIQATTSGAPAPLTTSFTLAVTLNPNFVFSEPTPFPNVKLGSTGTTGSITVSAQDGFTGTVTLTCGATFPPGACSLNPTSISSFPATVNLVINGTTFSPGSYQLSVQGISGAVINNFGVPFNVGNYVITGPTTLSATPGGQAPANLVFASTNFYSGQVNATCDATALSGAICTLSPANPITIGAAGSVSVIATINIPNDATPGPYNININSQDVAGEPTAAWPMTLTVSQDFTIGSLTPATQSINPGQSANYNFSVLPVGSSFTGAVTLSCAGAPTISLCSFSPNPVTPGNGSAAVVMTISTSASAAAPARHLTALAIFPYLWLALPALAWLGQNHRLRKRRGIQLPACLLGLLCLALAISSCGGGGANGGSSGGGGGGGQQQGTQPGSYTITVTGTSGVIIHQASSVTLVVNQ